MQSPHAVSAGNVSFLAGNTGVRTSSQGETESVSIQKSKISVWSIQRSGLSSQLNDLGFYVFLLKAES
jgi:hypothetical protein